MWIGITADNCMLFTTRILAEVWRCLSEHRLFSNNPDAPSEQHFLAHYRQADASPILIWTDKATEQEYVYDLSINQAQVTPSDKPYLTGVNQANRQLWEILPPELLEEKTDWKKAWRDAVQKLKIASIRFIIEQGFDVDTPNEQGNTALSLAAGFYGGDYDMVQLLVEAGADLTLPANTVDSLIWLAHKSATSSAEAHEARRIEHYLRSIVSNK
jgi:hypothetical protein